MPLDFASLIGFAAGMLTTVAFLPQVLKTWKTRSAKDISSKMYLMFCAGIFLWLVYGIYIESWPVIAANVVTFILASTVLYFKLKYS